MNSPNVDWGDDIPRERWILCSTSEELRAALFSQTIAEPTVIGLTGDQYNGGMIRTALLSGMGPSWNGLPADLGAICIRSANPSKKPIIDGIAWVSANPGDELRFTDVAVRPSIGNPAPFATPGHLGVARFRGCEWLSRSDGSYAGNGRKWGTRTYGTGLHFKDHKAEMTSQEHQLAYADNPSLFVAEDCTCGPSGRTWFQIGTRTAFIRPPEFLGVYVTRFYGSGLTVGAGGGQGLTVYGYPGPIEVDHVLSENSGDSGIEGKDGDSGGVIGIWEPSNWGGTFRNEKGWSNGPTKLSNILWSQYRADRPAVILEGVEEVIFEDIQGFGERNTIDIPGQYGLRGAGRVGIIGRLGSKIRSFRNGTPKYWGWWKLRRARRWARKQHPR